MAAGSRMRTGILFFALMFGSLAGVTMTPEQIEEAMSLESQAKIEYVLEEEELAKDRLMD